MLQPVEGPCYAAGGLRTLLCYSQLKDLVMLQAVEGPCYAAGV